MLCEVCGRQTEKPVKAEIEKVVMRVCTGCAKFGSTKASHPQKPVFKKQRKPPKGRAFKSAGRDLECVSDYSDIIRGAREKKTMKREDLARAINEKESVIARLESGAMIPDTKLARKIEKALGVKILEVLKDEDFSRSDYSSGGMTIGDLIK